MLKALSSSENIDSTITKLLVKNINGLMAILSQTSDSEMKQACLAVFYNTMASVDQEECQDFVLANMHLTQLYLSHVAHHKDDAALALAALECLGMMLLIGAQIEQENPDGEGNPVIDYCLSHSATDNLERAQTSPNAQIREQAKKIINAFFS